MQVHAGLVVQMLSASVMVLAPVADTSAPVCEASFGHFGEYKILQACKPFAHHSIWQSIIWAQILSCFGHVAPLPGGSASSTFIGTE
jgi:hypothetical protein